MSSMNVTTLREWGVAFWQERKPRERNALGMALAVIVAVSLYAFVFTPLMVGRQRLEQSLPTLRQQAAEMQALSKQAATIVDAVATPVPTPTKETIQSSLQERGLKAQSIVIDGGLARVQLMAVSFSSLLEWLNDAQKSARLGVVDASIVAQPAPDTVNATLTLQQHKSTSE